MSVGILFGLVSFNRGKKVRGTYDAGLLIQTPAERVDCNDMRALLVPRTVFTPVTRRHFFPGVVEVVRRGIDFHSGGS